MSVTGPARDRIRWHCRRGMLELDLILNAFLDEHLDRLEPQQLDAFRALLECPDPELLNLVMGHQDPVGTVECEMVALLREAVVRRAPGSPSSPTRLAQDEGRFVAPTADRSART